jgi:hypothetical protein
MKIWAEAEILGAWRIKKINFMGSMAGREKERMRPIYNISI